MSFEWPPQNTEPDWENGQPYYSDGTYSRHPLHVSPEGNVYGQIRWVHSWKHEKWWTGEDYIDLEVAGEAESVDQLPLGPRPWGQVWRVPEYVESTNKYTHSFWRWDSGANAWVQMKRLWDLDELSELPRPGVQVGAIHQVTEDDVRVHWNGFHWTRFRHSALKDDEPERHLPAGFLAIEEAHVELEIVAENELALLPTQGEEGLWVRGEWIKSGVDCSVAAYHAVIDWDGSTLGLSYPEPDTDYFVYAADSNAVWQIAGVPAGEHPAIPARDARGRLFISNTPDTDGYLGASGAGLHARLVGTAHTGVEGLCFVREVDASHINRTASFAELHWLHNDFQLVVLDSDTLGLQRLDGAYGQIYVAGGIHRIGNNVTLRTDAPRVTWNAGKLGIDKSTIAANAHYYIYFAGNPDDFNFNAVNPATNRPWRPEDGGSETSYDPKIDLRLKLFLCASHPVDGKLGALPPGKWARHIGGVSTDPGRKFIEASVGYDVPWTARKSLLEIEKLAGIDAAISFPDEDTALVTPAYKGATVVFPSLQALELPEGGIEANVAFPAPTFWPAQCFDWITGSGQAPYHSSLDDVGGQGWRALTEDPSDDFWSINSADTWACLVLHFDTPRTPDKLMFTGPVHTGRAKVYFAGFDDDSFINALPDTRSVNVLSTVGYGHPIFDAILTFESHDGDTVARTSKAEARHLFTGHWFCLWVKAYEALSQYLPKIGQLNLMDHETLIIPSYWGAS